MESLIFYLLSAVTLISAVCVVFLRRPMHNVLFMIIVMIGLAGLFILLHAEFIGMVQLVVYAGAVMVLFLFVIMLLGADSLEPSKALPWQKPLAELTPGRVLQGFDRLFAQIGTPTRHPKTRGKSPGWPPGRRRTCPARHKVVKRGEKSTKKPR